jgi:hypothetical protein
VPHLRARHKPGHGDVGDQRGGQSAYVTWSRVLRRWAARPDAVAWFAVVASSPFAVLSVPRLSSGFDSWPAIALVRHVRYGDSVLFAYPLPIYLPFAPLGLLHDPLPQLIAPAISFGFLVAGLWLWGARKNVVLVAALLSPVALGVLVNSNFNTGVAVFGLGLAIWAKQCRRYPLVGLGAALSLWRPANCLPVLTVLLMSGWRPRELLQAVAAATLFMAPLIALAFAVEPDWVAINIRVLGEYVGWAGLGPHLIQAAGPIGYAAAQLGVAIVGVWLLRRRTLGEAAAFSLALTVLLGTVGGAYSGAPALPALVLAARDPRYIRLPAAAGLVGWVQAFVLLAISFPVGVVAYWFVVQAYPLLRRPDAGRKPVSAPTVPGSQHA